MSENSTSKRVAIVGGGISGLAAALTLQNRSQHRCSVRLFEASDRMGGVLRTDVNDGWLIENSADSFIANPAIPWAKSFCEDVGLEAALIPTNRENRRAQIWFNGRLHAVPEGFQLMKPSSMWPILKSSLLSPWGKARLGFERFVPKRTDDSDESLASFATRRLGKEAFERLVQPLVSGIYTADPNKLSMRAALPQFLKMEQEHGSLIAASMVQNREKSAGARYNQFWSLRNGLESLVEATQQKLTSVDLQLSTPITSVQRVQNQWVLSTPKKQESFDAVILALPARHSATLLSDEKISQALGQIEHASSAVVCLGYSRQQLGSPLEAFGCVVPEIARRKILAISYSSMKFPERAPDGCELLRVFIGGALQPEFAFLDDDDTLSLVKSELQQILGVEGDPIVCKIARWENTMPQYHLGHAERVQELQARASQLPGVALAGNGLSGVGLPQCIQSGIQAAESISNFLENGEKS